MKFTRSIFSRIENIVCYISAHLLLFLKNTRLIYVLLPTNPNPPRNNWFNGGYILSNYKSNLSKLMPWKWLEHDKKKLHQYTYWQKINRKHMYHSLENCHTSHHLQCIQNIRDRKLLYLVTLHDILHGCIVIMCRIFK